MLSYNDLYELLRKEKYAETLQQLPKDFVEEAGEYLNNRKGVELESGDFFGEGNIKAKKQLENAIAIFKELMLRRKKKILSLVFVATETGIMKKDYENMLAHERDVFDKLISAMEEGDKELGKLISGKKEQAEKFRMIIFSQDVEKFVDYNGGVIGPFASGELANLDKEVAEVLVKGGKASYVEGE